MSESLRRSAWMLAVVAGAYVLSFFHRFAPAGIAQDLAVSFQTTAASLGVLAATYFYVYTVMQVPTGILVDTLGPRRILLLGAIVACAGSILFGLAPSMQVALVGRTLVGLGVSVTFIAMLKIIAVCGMHGARPSVRAAAITRSRRVSSTRVASMAGTLQPRPSISGIVP